MSLINLNIIGSGLLAAQAAIVLLLLLHKHGKPHHQAFLIFWLLFCLTVMFDYFDALPTQIRLPKLADFVLDCINIFALAGAAYALFRGERFQWQDRFLGIGAGAVVLLLLWGAILGRVVSSDTIIWKLFYISPNMLLSSATFLAVGIAMFRDTAFKPVRVPLLIIFCVYAMLQLHVYTLPFITEQSRQIVGALADLHVSEEVRATITRQLRAQETEHVQTMRVFFAAGKFSLLIALSAAAVSCFKGPDQLDKTLKGIQITTWIFSLGFTAAVLFYRALALSDIARKIIG